MLVLHAKPSERLSKRLQNHARLLDLLDRAERRTRHEAAKDLRKANQTDAQRFVGQALDDGAWIRWELDGFVLHWRTLALPMQTYLVEQMDDLASEDGIITRQQRQRAS